MELWQNAVTSQELVKESQAADLIPSGKYPFTVKSVKEATQKESFDDGKINPLFGKPVGRVEATLYGVGPKGYDELDGKNRTFFFNVCPLSLHDDKGKLMKVSKLAGEMAAASETTGKSFNDTIDYFVNNKARISVSQFTTSNGNAMNTAQGISKLQ